MFQLLLLIFLSLICCSQSQSWCSYTSSAASGNFTSPNYPRQYSNNANCTNTLNAAYLGSMSFVIRDLSTENCCDYVEISCTSHYTSYPVRFYGTAASLPAITLSPCTQAVVRFYTDSSVVSYGFVIDYTVTRLGACPSYCRLQSNRCVCTPTGTTPTPPFCSRLLSECRLISDYCSCSLNRGRFTTQSPCPYPCYYDNDFFGNRRCRCDSTTAVTCGNGCYRTTNERGEQICRCSPVTYPTTTCPNGCYVDHDYWGYQYCNCPQTSPPPVYCSDGCTPLKDAFGHWTCSCPQCRYPCYYEYDYYNRRVCTCPTTTTRRMSTTIGAQGRCGETRYDTSGTISSPNYPNGFPRGTDCYQYIYTYEVYSITIRVVDMDLYGASQSTCYYDYIRITGCDGSTQTICTSSAIPSNGLTFYCRRSYSSSVTIRFHPNSYAPRVYRGFRLSYSKQTTSMSCGGTGSISLSHGSAGSLMSPNYPRDFPSNSECNSYLYNSDYYSLRIEMTFETFGIGSRPNCQDAFLKIICEDDFTVKGTFCGYITPDRMMIDCSNLRIWLKSNSTNYYSPRYFKLDYRAVSRYNSYTSSPVYENHGNNYPAEAKLSLILGGGVAGFLFVVLIIVIIVITISHRRQTARMEQRHLDDLTILARSVNETRNGEDWDGQVTIQRNGDHGQANPGFNDPLGLGLPVDPPSYISTVRRDEDDDPLIQFDDDEENAESPAPVPVSSLDQQIPAPVLSSEQPETNSEC